MAKRVHRHIRSNVVGYLALFFALSLGTAYAVDKNSVKSKHIGAGQVRESDLGTGAVTGDKLAANSVDGENVVDNSLKGADVDESSLNLPAPPTVPSSLPPNGTAGGDLAGEYPNPLIGAGAVGTNEVDGSLTGDDIQESSLSGVVNGSGRVVTGSATGMTGTPFPERVILELPGWGEIDIPNCVPSATPANRFARIEFDSTGPSGVVWVDGGEPPVGYNSATSPLFGAGSPGNTGAQEVYSLFIVRDDSAQTAVVTAGERTGNTTCDFWAHAVIAG